MRAPAAPTRKKRVWAASVATCTAAAILLAITIVIGAIDDSAATSNGKTSQRSRSVLMEEAGDGNPYHDTLPCTGPEEPVNFEVFSAGSKPSGLPLTGTTRRCDVGAPRDGWPSNWVSYEYGDCEIAESATGCQRPLIVQTWPACQRSMADYSYEGKPLPYRELPKRGGARVVEFNFAIESRIEVYTKSATVVIFAAEPDLATEAVRLLRPQQQGTPPVTRAESLGGEPPQGLASPSDGSTKGALSCHS